MSDRKKKRRFSIDVEFDGQVKDFFSLSPYKRHQHVRLGMRLLRHPMLQRYRDEFGDTGSQVAAYYELVLHRGMAHTYVVEGDRKQALASIDTCTTLLPNIPSDMRSEGAYHMRCIALMQGALLFVGGECGKGLARVRNLKDMGEWTTALYFIRGRMLAERGKFSEALRDLDEAIKHMPTGYQGDERKGEDLVTAQVLELAENNKAIPANMKITLRSLPKLLEPAGIY